MVTIILIHVSCTSSILNGEPTADHSCLDLDASTRLVATLSIMYRYIAKPQSCYACMIVPSCARNIKSYQRQPRSSQTTSGLITTLTSSGSDKQDCSSTCISLVWGVGVALHE